MALEVTRIECRLADATGVKNFYTNAADHAQDAYIGDSFSSGVLTELLAKIGVRRIRINELYYTVQAIETVRKDLNAKSFRKKDIKQ